MEVVVELTVVEGDITEQDVDAIVNAVNSAMRGGGGVDGAIHAAAGPSLLDSCVERFPDGLPTGEAGWTPGFALAAQYVIHVGRAELPRGRAGPVPADLLLRERIGRGGLARGVLDRVPACCYQVGRRLGCCRHQRG